MHLVEALSLVLGRPLEPRPGDTPPEEGREVLEAIAPTGVRLDALAQVTGLEMPVLLSMLGRLEVDGTVRRDGELVLPGR